MEKQKKQWPILFSWAPKSLQMVTAAMKLKDAYSLEEKYDQTRQHTKKQKHYFANKSPSSQSSCFSSSHIWMWELDSKESWALKNWCFWTVVLEKTLESPLDCKEIQPVHPKGYQSWIFIGRTDAEAETPILSPPDVKNWLIGRDPQFSRSVVSDSLRPHESQHSRPPWPSPTPRVDSNSRPLSQWCHPPISSSVCLTLLLLPSIFPSIRGFSNKSALLIRWPKDWSFSISPSSEYSGLISFRTDWFDPLALQETLKSLLKHHSLKASIL